MPQNITVLVNECVDISDERKSAYLLALREVLDARILTVDNLNELRCLWANNSDSVYAFCELVKRIGSQGDDNVLFYRLLRFVQSKQLAVSQIHVLLQLHLLWLPVYQRAKSSMRSAMMLLNADPILYQSILGGVFDQEEECLIKIGSLAPFTPEKFHQQGVRIDSNGTIFISKDSIENLNSYIPARRPTVDAKVVSLTVNNMDFDVIHRYHSLTQLISSQPNLLKSSLDECIKTMRETNALPIQFANVAILEIKKALLPIHYHAEFDQEALEKRMAAEKRVASLLAPLQIKPSELPNDALALLLQLNSPILTPFIVHFAKMDFDFAHLHYFGSKLRAKLNIDWLSQPVLDFLMQLSPRELTDRAIQFFSATIKTDEKSTALALQARFQLVLWFGEEALENNDRGLLCVTKRFASSAADSYLRPAILKWIRDYGNIFPSLLTVNLLVSTFARLYPNHPALLAVVRETASQIELRVWETLVKESESREDCVAILSLCKATLSKDGCDQITDWVFKLNSKNEKEFVSVLINLLFKHRLLTTKELSDLYFDSHFRNQFNCIDTYFGLHKTAFLSAINRVLSNESVQQSAQESTYVDLQDSEIRMKAQLQRKLTVYRNANLIAVEKSGMTTYQPKGLVAGAAYSWLTRESTRHAAKAFNQLNNKMQQSVTVIISLIRDAEFKKQAGDFWETCCREFATEFSIYERQLQVFVQKPDRLIAHFFGADRFNEYEFNYILQLCSPELKAIIEEFVVVVRCGHGLNLLVFDALLKKHDSPQYFQTDFPVLLPLLACDPKPANAQLPNINPIEQCKLTAQQLYQYEECEILSGELALRAEFQDRIINVPENVRCIALDSSQPVLFHQIAPSDELGLRDPFSVRADDQRRFKATQERLRAALARYDGAHYQKPILFFGVINTINHYVPYVVTKSKNGRVFVFTADPSAQSTLIGSVEFKKGQGVCPMGDKENLKRTMRRFFTHTFPGCVYDDIYATQMLRERDCGPISLFVLREILQKNVISIFDDHVLFDRNKITVKTEPCYSNGMEYYYPSEFELLSRRARAYWHAVFTSDDSFNYQEALKSDCFEVDMRIPNENTYLDRAVNQFKRDQRQQHQSELCLFLNHPTRAFESLKEKLHRHGHLPTVDDIRVFVISLNDEIKRSEQSEIKQSWSILYDTYFQNGDLSSNTLIDDIRNIVIYNLKEPIQEAIRLSFNHYLSTHSHLLCHDNVARFVADFKQKESSLFSSCDVDDVEKLERILTGLSREKVVEEYIRRVACTFDELTIFDILVSGRADAHFIIRNYIDAEIVNNELHALHPLIIHLNQASKLDVLYRLIHTKIDAALDRFVNIAYLSVKAHFNELLENPMHHERLQTLHVDELVHWLLPDNASGILVGKNIEQTVLFNLVFQKLVEKTKKEFSAWVQELCEKKVAIFFASEKMAVHFNSLSLDQISQYLIMNDKNELMVTDVSFILNQVRNDAELYAFMQFYASFNNECETHIRRALLNALRTCCEELFESLSKSIEMVIAQTRFYDVKNYNTTEKDSFLPLLNLLSVESKNSLFQNDRLNLLGNQFIAYLQKSPRFLSVLIDAVDNNQLIDRKLNVINVIFKDAIELLQNGGYKGRRDQVIKILDVMQGYISDFRVKWNALNRSRIGCTVEAASIALKDLECGVLKRLRLVSSQLIALLRPENCDPVSTTQVIRALLCQLLNIDMSLQRRILTEVIAKQIDDAIVCQNAALSSRTLSQLVSVETRLILVTPNQSQNLPKLSDCSKGLVELIARSIAWWRVHHHSISAVSHPGLFSQRVMAPGGLSAELLSLINVVNTQGDIHAALTEYVLLNRLLINVETLTNTGKIIKNILDELLTIRQPFEINDAVSRRLLPIFADRWKQLSLVHRRTQSEPIPQNYLLDGEKVTVFDQFCIRIATELAKRLSFKNGRTFKMPNGLLMPGTIYDREIDVSNREYKVCLLLRAQLYLDTIDAIDSIPVNQLLFVDELPVSAGWYTSKVLAVGKENGVYDLYHPQQDDLLLTEVQIQSFDSFNGAGKYVFDMRYPGVPTDRSLRALTHLLHAMVLNGGHSFNYEGENDSELQSAMEEFMKTLASYPYAEQKALWSTVIPGLSGHVTIESVFKKSAEFCTHGTGRELALVIHQYYLNADAMLPRDAQRGAMSKRFAVEFRYVDTHKKIPFSNDVYTPARTTAAPALRM